MGVWPALLDGVETTAARNSALLVPCFHWCCHLIKHFESYSSYSSAVTALAVPVIWLLEVTQYRPLVGALKYCCYSIYRTHSLLHPLCCYTLHLFLVKITIQGKFICPSPMPWAASPQDLYLGLEARRPATQLAAARAPPPLALSRSLTATGPEPMLSKILCYQASLPVCEQYMFTFGLSFVIFVHLFL